MPDWRSIVGELLADLKLEPTRERTIVEELTQHLEDRYQELLRSGTPPEEAHQTVLDELRSDDRWIKDLRLVEQQEAPRSVLGERNTNWMAGILEDMRFAVRMLCKNPSFTLLAVLTLALGIGANTIVFSTAKSVLFRSFAFPQPEQLTWVRPVHRELGSAADRLSWKDYEDIDQSTTSFDALALFNSHMPLWVQGDHVEELPALSVTSSLAEVLRIRPALGRLFSPSDAEPSAPRVIMISHELWHSRFDGDPGILGKALRFDEELHTIVGILPPKLEFPVGRAPSAGNGSKVSVGTQHIWFPIRVAGEDRVSRGARMFLVIGRLKSNVSLETSQAELSTLARRLEADSPTTNRGWSFEAVKFRDQVLGRTRQGIQVLAVAVAAVLLICCVNLSNLLLARGVSRQKELAVRLALGAGRRRIIRALFSESLLISALGGAVGVALAQGGIHLIRVMGPIDVPFIRETSIDTGALFFTCCISIGTAFLFGLFPALRQSHIDEAETLRSGTRISAGPEIRVWQHNLLVAQTAIVLVLLTSAGLLLESFRRLMNLDLGYRPQSVVALDLLTWNLPSNSDGSRLYRQLKAHFSALPGVEAVGTIQSIPLTGKWTFNQKAQVFGRPVPETEQPQLAATFVAFDYFKAMEIPLIEGRLFYDFEMRDDEFPLVVILNQAAASTLFPGETALGNRMAFDNNPERFFEVIGVVKDTRDVRLDEKPQPRFYLNFAFGGAQFLIKSSEPAHSIIPMLRESLSSFKSRVLISEIKTMSEIVSGTVAERRFLMAMLVTYALVALVVAGVGIFGVVAYQVAQRTNEFGIRLTVGATPKNLVLLVIFQAGKVVSSGLIIGLLLSFASNRLLASQLFGISPNDPILLAYVSFLFLVLTLLASLLPARRAAKVDPMVALRYE